MYGRVSPIFKKDDHTDPGNYRPVFLLSVPSKLLKYEINSGNVNNVTSNNLMTTNHWAYRKGHSTELLLIHLAERWRRFVDSGLNVAVAFVDFKKVLTAYHTRTCCKKLHRQSGIDGQLYAWIISQIESNLRR